MSTKSNEAGSNSDKDAGSLIVSSKPKRADRKVAKRAAMLQTQAQEYAAAAGVPPTLASLQRVEAENLAALVTAQAGDSLRAMEGESRGEDRKLAGIGKGTPGPGRPSEYTEETGLELCAWIAGGGSLRAWCRHTGRAMDTVYRWMRQDARFHELYARAHEDRADTLADEMIEIADASAVDASIEGVAAAKLRVETRRFIASKLRPQKWGEKQTVEHVGAVNIRIGIPQRPAPDNVIEAAPITPRPPALR